MMGPNGSGKSTAWHLFTQTHYGASPNGAKKADFQHDEDVKDFLIESTFQKNNSIYTAAHAVKSKTLSPSGTPYGSGVSLYRDGKDISLHKDPDTLTLIKQTMGWTLEEWYGYVYLAQSTSHTLINGTRSARQSYLSALFNLLPLDTLHEYCKTKSISFDQQLADLDREKQEYSIKIGLLKDRSSERAEDVVKDCRDAITFLEQQLQGLTIKQAAFDRRKLLEHQLSIKSVLYSTDSLGEFQVELENLQQQEAAYRAGVNRRQKLETELQALPVILNPKIPSDYEQILETPDQNEVALTQEILALEEASLGICNLAPPEIPEDFEEVLASPDLDEFMTRQRLKKLRERPSPPDFVRPAPERIKMYEERALNLFLEGADLGKVIKHLEFGGAECDRCGTHLDVQHRAEELIQKKEELEAILEAHRKTKKILEDLKSQDAAWAAHDALGPDETGEIPSLEASVERYKTKKRYQAVQALEERYQKEQAVKKQVERLPGLISTREQYQRKVSYQRLAKQKESYVRYVETKTRIEHDLSEIAEGVSVAPDILALQTKIRQTQEIAQIEGELKELQDSKDMSNKINMFKTEQNDFQVKLGQSLREIEEVKKLTEDIKCLGNSIESKNYLQSEKTKYSLLTKGFGKAGSLRKGMLQKFSNYLEEALLAHTIRQLPEHRFTIDVDDGIDIMTSKNGCTPYDVKFMSGGEQGALSLAFLFALDDLLPPDRRTSVKIIDELEAHFDADRKQDFVQYTLPELRKRADTVIVISHSEAASDGTFDAYWTVDKGTILEVLPERREYEETVE